MRLREASAVLLIGAVLAALVVGLIYLKREQDKRIDEALARQGEAMLAMAQQLSRACGAEPTVGLLNAGVPQEKLEQWWNCFYGKVPK